MTVLHTQPICRKGAFLALGVFALGLAGTSLQAETKTWNSSSSSNLPGNNWTGTTTAQPTTTDEAVFSSPVPVASLNTSNTMTWGDLVWNVNSSSSISLSNGATSNRVFTLTGGGGSTAAIAAGGASGDLIVLGDNAVSQTLSINGDANTGGFVLRLTLGASGNFNVKNSGSTLYISSIIDAGTFNLNKTGAGTLVLDGNNFTRSGTLINVVGGTLAGTGRAGGSVVVKNGGTMAPGAVGSVGTFQTSEHFSMESGGILALQLNTSTSAVDSLNVGGDLTLASGSILTLQDLGSNVALAPNTSFTVLDYAGTWNGGLFTFAGNQLADDATFSFGANQFQISYNGLDGLTSAVTLTTVAVPEPSTASSFVLMGVLLSAAAWWRSRYRRA